MTILIVDDEQDIRELLEEFLASEGFEARSAPNGSEALRMMRDGVVTPSVVILDLLMPLMGGVELYERMQADPRLAKIPVIVSTSDPSRAPGGVPIMKKPVDLGRLMDVIRRSSGSC